MKPHWLLDRWFESWCDTAGMTAGIEVQREIESYSSKYQKIQVFQTCYGRLLVLDGTFMLTEAHEFTYHEMIAHPAMHVHPNPRKVLIVGGGDGGAAREVLKHDVDEVHLCEIDEEVINVTKRHFPSLAGAFDDPRLKVHIADGADFVQKNAGYDVILVDSTDPVGPGRVLFEQKFYRNLVKATGPDGIIVSQSENFFCEMDVILRLHRTAGKLFSRVRYYNAMVPFYPAGAIGFMFCSKVHSPLAVLDKEIRGLKYYSRDIHAAAFALPAFAQKQIYQES